MTTKDAPLTDLLRILSVRFIEDRCAQIASSLTFTTLLAIVPIVTVALAMVSAFPGFDSLITDVRSFVVNNMLPESVNAITTYTDQFSENAARLTAVGILFIGVTALLLMFTIDRAFNNIWRVLRARPLLQRILVYWTVLTVGPLFIGASLSLTSYLITLSLGLIDNPPGTRLLMLKFMSLLLTSIALALLYFTVPNRRILKRDALLGGIAAGICLEAMKQGFSFFITHFPTYKLVYGAFAAVPIFLLWIYLSWLIIISGAVLVAVLPEWRERAGQSQPVPGSDLFDVLQILKILWRAQQTGEIVTLSRLHSAVKLRLDHLERILDALVEAAWVARSGQDSWVLSRGAASIKLDDAYRRFVLSGDVRIPARLADPQLEVLIHAVSSRIAGDMQMSLEELFGQADRNAAALGAARVKAV